ncbi:MAG: DnaJ domain-containing protein [Bdellovibrionota bacterium]
MNFLRYLTLVTLISFLPAAGWALNYYEILGVTENASAQEITNAYRKKAKEHHPDMHTSSQEKIEGEKIFKLLNEAHKTLSDPESRQEYNLKNNIKAQNPESPTETTQTLEELKNHLENLRQATSEENIYENIKELAKFRDLIYSHKDIFEVFFTSMKKLIINNKLKNLSTSNLFLRLTVGWSGYYARSGDMWDVLQNLVFERLLMNGVNLPTLIRMMDKPIDPVDAEILQSKFEKTQEYERFLNINPSLGSIESNWQSRGFVKTLKFFQAGNRAADSIFRALFNSNQITNYKQFVTAVRVLKESPMYLGESLDGQLGYTFTFINEMNFLELLDLSHMTSTYPIEILALLENILESQSVNPRFTSEELTKLIIALSSRAFDRKGTGKIAYYGDRDLNSYLAAHKGYDMRSLEKLVQKTEAYEIKHNLSFSTYIAQTILYPILKKDIVDILRKNKKVINQLSKAHRDQIAMTIFDPKESYNPSAIIKTETRLRDSLHLETALRFPQFSSPIDWTNLIKPVRSGKIGMCSNVFR